ncbi:MAG: hypothetical protein ACREP7_01330 [Lysobacter sp.]
MIAYRKLLAIAALLTLSPASSAATAETAAEDLSTSRSPHAEAIALVMQQRKEQIIELERDYQPWFDTSPRAWSARRTAGPGIIDTRQRLEVSYAIEGKVVAAWSVDLKLDSVVDRRVPATDE